MRYGWALSIGLALSIGAGAPALAEKVYKWTDAQGNVHYGGQPPQQGARQVELHVPKSGAASAPAAIVNPSPNAPQAMSPEDAEKLRQEEEKQAAERQAIIDENCKIARKREAMFAQGGRIYDIDDKGERHYFSNEELAQKLTESKADVEKWCNQNGAS